MEGLKTIDLKGKKYVQVSERLRYFREHYSDGNIVTEYEVVGDRIIFKAKVFVGERLISTGTGMKNISQEFEVEKCETRAIGRALAIAGIGLEAGIASYDEIMDFHSKNNEQPELTPLATEKQLNAIRYYKDQFLVSEFISGTFNKTSLPSLTVNEASKVLEMLKGEK